MSVHNRESAQQRQKNLIMSSCLHIGQWLCDPPPPSMLPVAAGVGVGGCCCVLHQSRTPGYKLCVCEDNRGQKTGASDPGGESGGGQTGTDMTSDHSGLEPAASRRPEPPEDKKMMLEMSG